MQHKRRGFAAFNTREENPTDWEQVVNTGEDFLTRMTSERPGNVVVISGNNRHKTDYIKACADAGLNLLVDKPMCIDKQGFARLLEAFDVAAAQGVLLYDIMTERSEINTLLQKALMHNESVFGELRPGSLEEPAVELESVHHLFKYVSGRPLKRPGWYMDTSQQGEGIVDVTVHLVDLAAWQCFPGVAIDYQKDIEVLAARRWPTRITREQYQRVTGLDDFIPELKARLDDEGVLPCYANGEISFRIKGVHVKVRVMWNYQAPEGGKDTHFAVLRGTKANLVIRQGAEQNYRPELTIEPATRTNRVSLAMALPNAISAGHRGGLAPFLYSRRAPRGVRDRRSQTQGGLAHRRATTHTRGFRSPSRWWVMGCGRLCVFRLAGPWRPGAGANHWRRCPGAHNDARYHARGEVARVAGCAPEWEGCAVHPRT